MRLSIRARLTAWYVGALTVATLTLAGGSLWMSTQSVVRVADIGLRARVQGVRDFLENPRTELTVESLRDEFGEYAELTRGEALLDVVDGAGTVLVRPSIPGWEEIIDQEEPADISIEIRPVDHMLGRLPYRVASARVQAHGSTYRVTVAAPMGPAYEALNRFHRMLLLLLPGVVALAGAGGYWISRRALAPVDQITRSVQAITVRHLDQRLDVPVADDELRRLASTFNDVLEQLESAVGDIVRFTADASHELRTPVSLIRANAEIALRHDRSPQEYRTALADVVGQARHMSELVDDLLVLARSDAGIEPRDTTVLDLRSIASEAVRDVAEVAGQRSVRVCPRLSADPVIVTGDGVSLRRLLFILLDNAVKYSHPGGNVTFRVERSTSHGPHFALVEVSDDGIGVDPEDVSRVFERFYRGSRARLHAADGTGLGLAIARLIVDRYRGTITLASTRSGDGSGCTVTVELPCDRA
jgi:signal transduction histidine kinase